MGAFLSWLDRTVRTICDRPDHLQRLSIVGAGVATYPAIASMILVLIWFALDHPGAPPQIVGGLINIVYILLALYALVIVSMLGTIKGLRIGPSGLEVSTTADDPDVDPSTTRDTRLGGDGSNSYSPGYQGDDGASSDKGDVQVTQ